MRVILATTWWSLLIRGFAALALAVLLLILREISLSHLALLFFGYAMIDGVVNLALGMVMVAVPLAAATAVAFWLSAYAFVFGVLLVDLAIQQRARIGFHPAHRVERPA